MATKILFGAARLTSLPDKIYLDSNILLSAFLKNHKFHHKAKSLLFAMFSYHSVAYLSPLSLDESWWALIKIEYKKIYRRDFDQHWLKNNMYFIQDCQNLLNAFQEFIDKYIQKKKFQILDLESRIINNAYSNLINIPMMPRDSFHLAILRENGVSTIATTDTDFDNIPDQNLQIIAIR